MQEFATPQDLAAAIGLDLRQNDTSPGFRQESDWGIYRGSGFGLPGHTSLDDHGGDPDGWLVTFAHNSQLGDGYLIAYASLKSPEADDDDFELPRGCEPRGRCLLLAGPWSTSQDEEALLQASRRPWWKDRSGGAVVDVKALARWLSDYDPGPRDKSRH